MAPFDCNVGFLREHTGPLLVKSLLLPLTPNGNQRKIMNDKHLAEPPILTEKDNRHTWVNRFTEYTNVEHLESVLLSMHIDTSTNTPYFLDYNSVLFSHAMNSVVCTAVCSILL